MFAELKKREIIWLFTLFFSFTFTYQTLEAATLHAILVADTNDENIGPDTAVDLNNVYYQLQKAASKSGMSANISTISGRLANRELVIQKFEQLQVEFDDVVVAYFSMHGYRFRDKESVWPNLYFGESDNGLELEYIIDEISSKNPRLLIAIADTCNTFTRKGSIPTKSKRDFIDWILGTKEKENYKKLFLEPSGTIIASGSISGTPSWGNSRDGGLMTASLLESLKDVVGGETEDVSWESVFSQIENRIDSKLNEGMRVGEERMKQTPQYLIELH